MNPPLSRREHFALAILQSLIGHPKAVGIPDTQIVASAVRNADALIAELDKTTFTSDYSSVSPPELPPDDSRGPSTRNEDAEHLVQLDAHTTDALRMWLKKPNGSFCPGRRVTVEAVADGGILIRTKAYAKIVPVSPPALPVCPEHVPKPPEDCVYVGNGPLDVEPETKDRHDVLLLAEEVDCDKWDTGFTGVTYRPTLHIALRRGSAIARANGIPD